MSTRGQIIITGKGLYNKEETYVLYTPSDSYPTAQLELIHEALHTSMRQVKDHNKEWKLSERELISAQVCGVLIGKSSDVYGMGAFLEKQTREVFNANTDCLHSFGIEWTYVINLHRKTIKVCKGAQGNFCSNPLDYLKCLNEDAQPRSKKLIEKHLKNLIKLGFKINR